MGRVDVSVTAAAEGRFRIPITIMNRFVSDEKQVPQIAQRAPGIPLFRNFIIATTLQLGDGQTTRIAGIDPITNENWQADVTLSVKNPQTPPTGPSTGTTGIPVKIQLGLTTADGNRQTMARYTLAGSSSGESSSLKIATEVPVSVPTAQGQTAFTLQQMGTQIDYRVSTVGDRYALQLTITSRTFSGTGEIKSLMVQNTQTLRDGETTRFTGTNSAGEAYSVDVALSVVK